MRSRCKCFCKRPSCSFECSLRAIFQCGIRSPTRMGDEILEWFGDTDSALTDQSFGFVAKMDNSGVNPRSSISSTAFTM
jgi:hypothetical protein